MAIEIIGSKEKAVAVVEIREGVNEKDVIKEIVEKHRNVKSILKKISGRKGELRLRKFELIWGDPNTEVMHKEFGYKLKVDPQKVYFSAREVFERQRIVNQVKENEIVLIMFSGVMPFGIAIAKKVENVKVYGIEINEDAHKYAAENVRINKVSHKVYPILGDVREKCKQFFRKCDRVLMPLPFEAHKYFDLAVECLKEKGVLHFYSIGDEPNVFEFAKNFVSRRCKELGIKFEILNERKVQMYAPRKWKICLDVEVEK